VPEQLVFSGISLVFKLLLTSNTKGALPMTTTITANELNEKLTKKDDIQIIDVRRKADYEKSPDMIPGATWQDPEKIAEWSKTIPKDKEVVVYCVKGGSVSQSVADSLQEINPTARFLEGGILGWEEKQK
jgi:rhodanese-related sulfurtransferase